MRPFLFVTFFLFSILISHAQGIRPNKGFLSNEDRKIQKGVVTKTSEKGADVEAMNIKNDRISGDTRKLMAKATSIPLKNNENKANVSGKTIHSGGKDKSLSVDSTLGPEHRDVASEQSPDIIDLTGMDYSPAKRKPPIHN